MIPVIVESPFKGKNKAEESLNRAYLDACIRDCVLRGETPYASHKMLTDALDDSDPKERELGIACGLALRKLIRKKVFYIDLGTSSGMSKALELYESEPGEHEYEFRSLPWWDRDGAPLSDPYYP